MSEPRIFAAADFSRLELHCYAEVCYRLFGFSRLGDMLNSGQDPLTSLAARMAKVSIAEAKRLKEAEDPEFSNTRTCAKGAMYGFMGMLGPKSFPGYAMKAYRVRVTEDQTREYKAAWREEVPESKHYEAWVKSLQSPGGRFVMVHPVTGFVRSCPTITSACNNGFQHLGAAAAGAAVFEVSEGCYALPNSPLFGARVVNFPHDEIMVECDAETGHETLLELERVMVAAATPYLKHVPPKVDGKLMTWWSKAATRVVGADGRVVPWPTPTD